MPKPDNVGVGVACAIYCNRGVLMLKRQGAHAAGHWSFPGGWLDVDDDSLEAAAEREVREETGLVCFGSPEIVGTHTELHPGPLRTVTVYCWADVPDDSEPEILEPDKCSELRWVNLWAGLWGYNTFNDLPDPLFPGVRRMLPKIRDTIGTANKCR